MKQLNPKAKWLFFLSFLGRILPAVIVLAFFWLFVWPDVPTMRYRLYSDLVVWVPIVLVGLVVVGWIWSALSYRFYRYELREDGFRKESGIIWKKYTTIPYGRIQNVDIYRGLIARLLGLSDLHIQTAGGVATPKYNALTEGRLPGLSREEAEKMRDELVKRVQQNAKNQGL